jgi:hypothetical protein
MEGVYRKRRPLVAKLLEERPICQAKIPRVCTGRSEVVHEPLTRGRGGDVLDPTNCLCLCDACHAWAHSNQIEAHERGLLKHSWERD